MFIFFKICNKKSPYLSGLLLLWILKWDVLLCRFVFCIPYKPDSCKKENGSYDTCNNDHFYIPCSCSAIHKTKSCIDQSCNAKQ